MVGSTPRPRRDAEHDDAAVRMSDLLDVHTKTDLLKQSVSRLYKISKGCGTDYRPRCTVGNTKHQMTATLIGNGDAIF
jgi:hypothetical protein